VLHSIRSAIKKLPDESETKKGHEYSIGDISVCNQADWKQLGDIVPQELRKAITNPLNDKQAKNQSPIYCSSFWFLASRMGQSREFTARDIAFNLEFDTSFTDYYGCLNLEKVTELAVHWAKDYPNKTCEDYISMINTAHASSMLRPNRSCQYFNQAGLGAVGNLQYKFKHGEHRNIAALQMYSSWTKFIKQQADNYFLTPQIADNLSNLSDFVSFHKLIGTPAKSLFTKYGLLLREAPNTMVEFFVKILHEGSVSQRIEVVWTTNEISPGSKLSTVVTRAEAEATNWLNSMHLLDTTLTFVFFKKSEMKTWLEGTLLPCSKTIRSGIQVFQKKAIQTVDSFFELPDSVIMTPEVYRSLVVAEYILAFTLLGKATKFGEGPAFRQELDLRMSSTDLATTWRFQNVELDAHGRLEYVGPADAIPLPRWLKDQRLPFLRAVKGAINSDNASLTGEILSYIVAHAATIAKEPLPVPFSMFFWSSVTLIPRRNRQIISSRGLVTRLQRGTLLASRTSNRWKKVTDHAANLLKQVFRYKMKVNELYTEVDLRINLDIRILENISPLIVPFGGEELAALPSNGTGVDAACLKAIWHKAYNWLYRLPLLHPLSADSEKALDFAFHMDRSLTDEEMEDVNYHQTFEAICPPKPSGAFTS